MQLLQKSHKKILMPATSTFIYYTVFYAVYTEWRCGSNVNLTCQDTKYHKELFIGKYKHYGIYVKYNVKSYATKSNVNEIASSTLYDISKKFKCVLGYKIS